MANLFARALASLGTGVIKGQEDEVKRVRQDRLDTQAQGNKDREFGIAKSNNALTRARTLVESGLTPDTGMPTAEDGAPGYSGGPAGPLARLAAAFQNSQQTPRIEIPDEEGNAQSYRVGVPLREKLQTQREEAAEARAVAREKAMLERQERPPETVNRGQGVRQPDGSYKVPIPEKEPPADRTLVPVQLEDGSVVYKSRAEAEGQAAPRPGAQGSAKLKSAVAANTQQTAVIDDALKELDTYPDAVGLNRAIGMVPGLGGAEDYINQRKDPKGIAARAQLSNIGSLIIHDRSGAAVTVSEFPRLAPFVPRVGDTPEAIRTKLAKLKQNIAIETDALNEQLGVSGPASTGSTGGRGASPQTRRSTDMKPGGKTITVNGKTFKVPG